MDVKSTHWAKPFHTTHRSVVLVVCGLPCGASQPKLETPPFGNTHMFVVVEWKLTDSSQNMSTNVRFVHHTLHHILHQFGLLHLDVSENDIGCDNFRLLLAVFTANDHMETINLADCKIDGECVASLCQILKTTN